MVNKLFPLLRMFSDANIQNQQGVNNNELIQVNDNIFGSSDASYMQNPIKSSDNSIFISGGQNYNNPNLSSSDEFVPAQNLQTVPENQPLEENKPVEDNKPVTENKPASENQPVPEDVNTQAAKNTIKIINVNKDGVFGNTEQAKEKGDCWLLSAVNAMKETPKGREVLSQLIEVKDGHTTFHFGAQDNKTDIDVSDEEVSKARDFFNSRYSSGDDDMIALEIAVEKYLSNAQYNENTPEYVKDIMDGINQSSIDSGNFEKALYILAGKAGTIYKQNSIIKDGQILKDVNGIDQAINTYLQNSSDSQIMNASITKGQARSLTDLNNGQAVNLKDEHQYCVKSMTDKEVIIVDPWNSAEEIKISLNDFRNTFTQIEYADLNNDSDDRNYN